MDSRKYVIQCWSDEEWEDCLLFTDDGTSNCYWSCQTEIENIRELFPTAKFRLITRQIVEKEVT